MLGRLLDTLIVKIVGDISDFRAKMIEAARLTEEIGRHVGDTLGRQFALGDAIHAGIALPMIAAATVVSAQSARMIRDIAAARGAITGAAAAAALPPPAARPSAAATVAPAIAGALTIPGVARPVEDDRRRGLLYPRLRAAERTAEGELDDSYARRYAEDIARGGGVAPAPVLALGPHDPEIERRRAARHREAMRQAREEERLRRQHGENLNLSEEARERLSGAAQRAGQGVRGALGAGIARALGLTGLGALIGSLIPLVGELASLLGTGLVAALTALTTPLGLVVAAFAALLGLFALTRWEDFRRFIDWVAGEARAQWERFSSSIMGGLSDLGDAFKELGETLFGGEGGDTFTALFVGALQLIVAVCTRSFAAIGEIIETGLRTVAEIVRAFSALLRGDWGDLWNHLVAAFKTLFVDGLVNVIDAFFPGFRERWDEFWGGVADVFGTIWDGIVERFEGALGRMRAAWRDFWRGAMTREQRELLELAERAGQGDAGARREFERRARGGGGKSGGSRGKAGGGLDEKLPPGLRSEETEREVNAFASYLGGQLSSALKAMLRGQRVTVRDFFAAILTDIADLLIDRLAQSIVSLIDRAMGGVGGAGGGLWGVLGTVFGGGYQLPGFGGRFADGGYLAPGKWGIVGEKGVEIVHGGRAGMTITPMAAGGALYMPISISAPGADPAQLARLVGEVRQLRADMPRIIAAKTADMRQRGRI